LISHNQTILGVRGIKTAYLLFKLILKNWEIFLENKK
jgi:hypothetical protein